jgi:hypothetical protein
MSSPRAFPRTDTDKYADGMPLYDLCWGKVYPVESLTYDGDVLRFYNTRGAIQQFLKTLLSPFVLLRREYELAYEYIENEERKAPETSFGNSPKLVLTGQPGIGAHIVSTNPRVLTHHPLLHLQEKPRSSSMRSCGASSCNCQRSCRCCRSGLSCLTHTACGIIRPFRTSLYSFRPASGSWWTLVLL